MTLHASAVRLSASRAPVVGPDEPMGVLARAILKGEFAKMRANEKGVRSGEDPENVHDMRVAVRRMRTVARICGPFFEPTVFDPLRRDLRKVGRRLGSVRDAHVLLSNARRFAETLSARARPDLDRLIASWDREARDDGERLVRFLDGPRYRRFRRSLSRFLDDDGALLAPLSKRGVPRPILVRHAAPPMIYERLAAVLAFDGWFQGPDVPEDRYHRLRIEAKRLRYTLEFFQDLAGPEADLLIQPLVAVQDHLGEFREAVLMRDRLQTVVQRASPKDSPGRHDGRRRESGTSGIQAYLEDRRGEARHLLETFPAVWDHIVRADFRRRVAAIVQSF